MNVGNVPVPQQLLYLARVIAPAQIACTLRQNMVKFIADPDCWLWREFVGKEDLANIPDLPEKWSRWMSKLSNLLNRTLDLLYVKNSRTKNFGTLSLSLSFNY